jgi:hypothetical protein
VKAAIVSEMHGSQGSNRSLGRCTTEHIIEHHSGQWYMHIITKASILVLDYRISQFIVHRRQLHIFVGAMVHTFTSCQKTKEIVAHNLDRLTPQSRTGIYCLGSATAA